MRSERVTSVRMSVELADDLALIARVDGVPMSESIRQAVAEHIAARHADPHFQDLLRARLAADRAAHRGLEAAR